MWEENAVIGRGDAVIHDDGAGEGGWSALVILPRAHKWDLLIGQNLIL